MNTQAVFLSYASEDASAALAICASLRAAGIEVWLDQSELRGGDAWDRQIRRQIHECALFIALISAHSNARGEGYFRREWRLAVERTHDMADDTPFLLPVVIDDTTESDARVPESFREVHWARLAAGQVPHEFVEHVCRLLRPVKAVEPLARANLQLSVTGAPAPAPSAPRRWPPRSRWPALAIAAATVLAIGVFAIARWGPLLRPATEAEKGANTVERQASIAVLPFADMSERKDQEYFADGMAEEILDLLTKLPELRVIGRTSSFQFKSRSEDLRTIGEKLGAAYLVEGSVRKAGSRIRVTAQLIDADSGTQLWADRFDREFGDILDLQDHIASAIARALQLAVVAEDARPRRPLQSPEAYTHYLRGRAALDQGTADSLIDGMNELEQALTLDPGFTRAAEALALANLMQMGNTGMPSKVGWPKIEAAARQALQLDPGSTLAHAILGLQYATYAYNWPAATAELRQALAVETRDPVALYHLSWLAFDLGWHEEALRLENLSVVIDPLNPDAHQNGAIINYLIGNLDAAERGLRASMQISPTFNANHFYLGLVYLQRGDANSALKEMLAETSDQHDIGLAMAYHALGRSADSDAALARATRAAGNVQPMNIAIAHAYRGERDQTFAWIEKAIENRDLLVGHKFWDEPTLEPLRSDPRYRALLARLNRPEPNP